MLLITIKLYYRPLSAFKEVILLYIIYKKKVKLKINLI